MKFPYLSLIKPSILNGAVWFVERLIGVGHVPVPKSGLLLIRDAEEFPHFLLYHVCSKQKSALFLTYSQFGSNTYINIVPLSFKN